MSTATPIQQEQAGLRAATAINGPVMTVQQAAQKWDISIRRVSKLCQDGRIAGATKLSARIWLIPANAKKPPDGRYRSMLLDNENCAEEEDVRTNGQET